MKRFLLLVLLSVSTSLMAQSLEIMPGTQRIFVDAQWLKTFDEARKWSVFSRSTGTVDYQENTSLFTGAYLSYTTSSGFGGTLNGTISSRGAGANAGVHFFKGNESLMVFALASVGLRSELSYSWFSILRYTPSLGDIWRLYSSLELFSGFGSEGHEISIQRVRAGLNWKGYQFGLAVDLSGTGSDYHSRQTNPGVFLRKQF